MGSMLTYQLTTQVLFLMGAAGSLTGGHLLDALLECGAVPQPSKDKKRPEKLRASAWNLLTGFGSKINLTLTSKQMHRVKGAMGEHAVLIEQKSGHGVWVPPGWLHFVYNNQTCFKIAFERRIQCSFTEAGVDVVIKGKGKVKVNASEDCALMLHLCALTVP
ncbi:hypothetical protein COO60DRAFT_1620033 [Scenedesmus sp. NREL 46B-D3]|nr:hypothetical protein COO60DRAFT_1620033 [Scenedesmus sp. NREL 46B-D3]